MEFDIKEKMGPLPIWAWGLIFGAAALAFYYIYARGSSGSLDGDGEVSNLSSTGYHTAGINGGSATAPEADEADNEGWLANASRRVADALAVSPSDVRAALYKWLTGQNYTQAEKVWIDRALAVAGSPPQGTTGQGTVTPTPPTVITKEVKSPVAATSYVTLKESSVFKSLAGSDRYKSIPKGTRVSVVTGGSPTRARIIADGGFGYIARTNIRKV